jgi:putative spermidine/putrescine transport system ATP-binding protein
MSESSKPSVAVRLENVSRHFGTVHALDNISLEINDGEFFSMLGPSGSGKTTCLRLIAGFEQPTSGKILLHERNMVGVPPYERDVNTVFQDYALFPHMTIGDNIGYGLMIKKVPRQEREKRVTEMLEMVRLPGVGKRKPGQLSGGQRQRVALARALINHPSVLLLDEPLGALDLKLRQEMQIELKSIQQTVGITFIYVTHDQEEALTMSDRIAVFSHGHVEQVGSPAEIYERPATRFVAGFVGTSNVYDDLTAERLTGQRTPFSVRPEKMRLGRPEETFGDGWCCAPGVIRDVVYLGMHTRYLVELDGGGDATVVEQNLNETSMSVMTAKGRRVQVAWAREHNHPLVGNRGANGSTV